MKNVITISRETGSGGHTIGLMLAKKLGYEFYDAEIMEMLSEKFQMNGFDEEHMDRSDEFNLLSGFVPFRRFDRRKKVNFEEVNQAKRSLIRELAEKGRCVIVGRNADYILKDDPNCLHVFVHASMKHRVERVLRHEKGISSRGERVDRIFSGGTPINLGQEGESAAQSRIRRELEAKDRTRRANYEYFTGRTWGTVDNYHLVLDTTIMTKTDACEIIESVLQRAKEEI